MSTPFHSQPHKKQNCGFWPRRAVFWWPKKEFFGNFDKHEYAKTLQKWQDIMVAVNITLSPLRLPYCSLSDPFIVSQNYQGRIPNDFSHSGHRFHLKTSEIIDFDLSRTRFVFSSSFDDTRIYQVLFSASFCFSLGMQLNIWGASPRRSSPDRRSTARLFRLRRLEPQRWICCLWIWGWVYEVAIFGGINIHWSIQRRSMYQAFYSWHLIAIVQNVWSKIWHSEKRRGSQNWRWKSWYLFGEMMTWFLPNSISTLWICWNTICLGQSCSDLKWHHVRTVSADQEQAEISKWGLG